MKAATYRKYFITQNQAYEWLVSDYGHDGGRFHSLWSHLTWYGRVHIADRNLDIVLI